jgi:lysozyme
MNKITPQVMEFIAQFEGFSSKPYLDPVDIPTIGYGTITYPNGKRVTMKDKAISKSQALKYKVSHIEDTYLNWVNENLPDLNTDQFTAIVSLIYNIGLGAFKTSTLLRFIKANKECTEIRRAFLMWNKAGGKVLNGLTRRRAAEADLYCS